MLRSVNASSAAAFATPPMSPISGETSRLTLAARVESQEFPEILGCGCSRGSGSVAPPSSLVTVAALDDLLARLDTDQNRKGKQFERICQWFLTNDPLYKARLRHVWLWKEWTDGWSDTEAGIDLVAEDYDGHRWAVQTTLTSRNLG